MKSTWKSLQLEYIDRIQSEFRVKKKYQFDDWWVFTFIILLYDMQYMHQKSQTYILTAVLATLTFLWVSWVAPVSAELVFDPVTNRYIDSSLLPAGQWTTLASTATVVPTSTTTSSSATASTPTPTTTATPLRTVDQAIATGIAQNSAQAQQANTATNLTTATTATNAGTTRTISTTVETAPQIVFDPKTWLYVTVNGDALKSVLDGDEVEWIPVDENPQPVATATDTEETAEVSTGTMATPPAVATGEDTIASTPVQRETVTLADTTIVSVPTSAPVASVPAVTTYETMSIKDLKALLKTQQEMLVKYAEQKSNDVRASYNDQVADIYGPVFDDLLSCVGDNTTLNQITADAKSIEATLVQRVKNDAAALFAEISELQYKKSVWLITAAQQWVEWWALATRIDTYAQNAIVLVDHYQAEAVKQIESYVKTKEWKKHTNQMKTYAKRKELLDQVKQTFAHFENGTFFNQTVIWPRADELQQMTQDAFDTYIQRLEEIQNQWGESAFKIYRNNAYSSIQTYSQDLINELFPSEGIQDIYKSYDLVADIYDLWADVYDCQAVLSNKQIEKVWTTLINKIQNIQEEIAVANSAVGTPKNRSQLRKWFQDGIQAFMEQNLLPTFEASFYEKSKIEKIKDGEVQAEKITVVANARPGTPEYDAQLKQSYVTQIVLYLEALKVSYQSRKQMDRFEEKLTSAYIKVEKMLAEQNLTGTLAIQIDAIRVAIEQVIAGL